MRPPRCYVLSFFLILFIIATFGVASAQGGKADGEEILVAKEVVVPSPMWCGNNLLVYWSGDDVLIYNVEKAESFKVGGAFDLPMACTRDGRWYIYLDKDREKTGKGCSAHEEGEDEKPFYVDLWRYDTLTGGRELLAVIDDLSTSFGEGIISPDGKTLLLAGSLRDRVNIPPPRWEVFWTDLPDLSTAVWLWDSSAVLIHSHRDPRNHELAFEMISHQRKTVFFPYNMVSPDLFAVDRKNRIYVKDVETAHINNRHFFLKRCGLDLKDARLACETILDLKSDFLGFALLPRDEFLFSERDGHCTLRISDGKEPECATSSFARIGDSLTVSPDGRWLAFGAYTTKDAQAENLYIKRLK